MRRAAALLLCLCLPLSSSAPAWAGPRARAARVPLSTTGASAPSPAQISRLKASLSPLLSGASLAKPLPPGFRQKLELLLEHAEAAAPNPAAGVARSPVPAGAPAEPLSPIEAQAAASPLPAFKPAPVLAAARRVLGRVPQSELRDMSPEKSAVLIRDVLDALQGTRSIGEGGEGAAPAAGRPSLSKANASLAPFTPSTRGKDALLAPASPRGPPKGRPSWGRRAVGAVGRTLRRLPFATAGLITLNTYAYAGPGYFADETALERWGMTPQKIQEALATVDPAAILQSGATLVTNLFMHGSKSHLLGNMFFLGLFGAVLEAQGGSRPRFLGLYLLAGVAGALVHLILNWGSPVTLVGASGAIFGLAGILLVTALRRFKDTLASAHPDSFFRAALPSITIALAGYGLWKFLKEIPAMFSDKGWVAHHVHVAGYLAGALFALLWRPRAKSPRTLSAAPPTRP